MTSSTSNSGPTALPSDAIQRVLFLASGVHVYKIPPLTSNKGYLAAHWTAPNTGAQQIFTARLRIIETAIPQENEGEVLNTDILLEDPSTAELFANVPYNDPKAVEPAVDSSRFFAVRVVGPTGEKAVLGVGFEERGEAIDFAGALQEARKVLGLEPQTKGKGAVGKTQEAKKDYGLKEGETIKVDLNHMKRVSGKADEEDDVTKSNVNDDKSALFSIKPPPSTAGDGAQGAIPLLAPPPSTQSTRAEKRRSRGFDVPVVKEKTATELGFDDGEFGEFQ